MTDNKETRMRKAHEEWCQAMNEWHKDKSKNWEESKRQEIADRWNIEPEEWREWQNS